MKRESSFLLSLVNYTWKLLARLFPSLPYIGTLVVGLVILASVITHKTSVVGARNLRELSVKAAMSGDYVTAQIIWAKQSSMINHKPVGGVSSEIEELIYPQQVVVREIEKYQEMLVKYPGHRDIYIALARLHKKIGDMTTAKIYELHARELDPNNLEISSK